MPVHIGFPAPKTANPIQSTQGEIAGLDQFRGKHLVLFFYPKDNTPGCTTESMDFVTQHKAFVKAGAVVFGVSRDSLKSHDAFRATLEAPFHLISDPQEELCLGFDVMRNKMMYGKQVRGLERSTFVFDRMGDLAREWRGVKVEGHAAEVLAFVKSLG
jgi:thioredoxin-dependent peroxiredoxin